MKKSAFFTVAIYLASLALLAALYTFLIIPQVKKKTSLVYEEMYKKSTGAFVDVLTYKGETPLMSGVVLTDVNRNNFEVVKVPANLIVENAVCDFDLIKDRMLKYTVVKGQQISFDLVGQDEEEFSSTRRLKEFKVKSLVGELAMKGTYVDIIARFPDGSYQEVISRIRIYDILCTNVNGKCEYLKDSDGFYTIILAVNEEEFRTLNNALLTGYLDTRLHLVNKVSGP
ncbi:MAG TPA: hypothetical protein PLI11_07260 [Clostridia bacterium]|mgnify:CR=1 FL=1|jgi:hypothetical protein|nr:hypothetical protein [Clostridiaceae bacterium]HOA31020.1 hypothetical protein [Clostridia bacterium]HPZ52700.1 hypothetical protein [Clostridia bacterium]